MSDAAWADPYAVPDDEGFLAARGVHRLPVPIPFLEAGGPVNIYLIENGDGSYTLFDAGLRTAAAEEFIRARLEELGVSLSRIGRVLVSHGHIDHYGLAQTWAEASGAKVSVHPGDWDKVAGLGHWSTHKQRYVDYFLRCGVKADVVAQMIRQAEATQRLAGRVEEARLQSFVPGERLRFAHFEAEVVHLPGHTPGLCCLWDADAGWLFANDHLLARVSPNPLLELGDAHPGGKFRALETYLLSAQRAHDLDIRWVLPGHGPPFQGHRRLLDGLFDFYKKRQEKVLKQLAHGEATPVELVKGLFGRSDGPHMFLMLSELLGNLEVLETQGRVVRKDGPGGAVLFQAAR